MNIIIQARRVDLRETALVLDLRAKRTAYQAGAAAGIERLVAKLEPPTATEAHAIVLVG